MNVQQLIHQLQQLRPDAEVHLLAYDTSLEDYYLGVPLVLVTTEGQDVCLSADSDSYRRELNFSLTPDDQPGLFQWQEVP